MNILKVIINSPWKLTNEILMYVLKPFAYFYVKILCGVKIGYGAKFYGLPKIYRHRRSKIIIGDNFECRSWWFSNPLGINHPVIISTWRDKAILEIGNDVGISGGSIVASEKISIGNRILIGANSTIIDSDFHPLNKGNKRYSTLNVKTKEIYIGDDVFIGMNSSILKGSKILKNEIVPAGAVVRSKT